MLPEAGRQAHPEVHRTRPRPPGPVPTPPAADRSHPTGLRPAAAVHRGQGNDPPQGDNRRLAGQPTRHSGRVKIRAHEVRPRGYRWTSTRRDRSHQGSRSAERTPRCRQYPPLDGQPERDVKVGHRPHVYVGSAPIVRQPVPAEHPLLPHRGRTFGSSDISAASPPGHSVPDARPLQLDRPPTSSARHVRAQPHGDYKGPVIPMLVSMFAVRNSLPGRAAVNETLRPVCAKCHGGPDPRQHRSKVPWAGRVPYE